VVFASTTSKVAHFASPQALFNSARVSVGGELIFPPFCQLGWDQYAPALGRVPPAEVARLKHILRYGRPLWLSVEGLFLPTAIVTLASNKLIGVTPYEGSDDKQALVLLAQRFGLDVCFGHREAVRFVESTVASHMRICITTTEDRLWSYTTYPSEPFLSCVAAYSMHRTEKSVVGTLHILKSKVENGMIDIGQCGELVSRLIWLLAKDFFVIRSNNTNSKHLIGSGYDAELVHCQMIPVIEFLEFLFGNDFWGKVEHDAGHDAKEAFQDAFVNFSHWVSMQSYIRQEDKKPEDQMDLNEWTMRHWQRTCAIQCCHSQPSIDKVIPIYFKSAVPGPKGVDCVSQILISDKARTSKQHDALIKIQRNDPTIGGQLEDSSESNALPYIAIVADLRLKEKGLENVTFPTRASRRTSNDTVCLRIRACGLCTETYRFFEHYPKVLEALDGLLERGTIPPKSTRPLTEYTQNQVEYGKSGEVQHMEWERGSVPSGSLQNALLCE